MATLVDTSEITIVDLGNFETKTLPQEPSADVLRICDEIKVALANRGLVFLVNHGIPEAEIKHIFLLLDQFLALPDNIKELYKSNGSKDYHGYIPPNTEKFYNKRKVELRESFNITCFDRKFPNEEIPEFSKCAKELFDKLTAVTNLFLQLLAVGLGLNPDYFLKYHTLHDKNKNTSILRLLCYPPVQEDPNDGIIRIEEHTDYGTCTLLLQDSEGGLEVKGMDGEWRRVGYIPGGILINTADMLEVQTSGEYKAALHRVVVPKEKDIRSRIRHSLAFFVHPDASNVIKPIDSASGSDIKGYTVIEHINNRINESETIKEDVSHQSG